MTLAQDGKMDTLIPALSPLVYEKADPKTKEVYPYSLTWGCLTKFGVFMDKHLKKMTISLERD